MSISVTVSGQDSISVVSSQPLTDTVEISSISALDPLKTATGLLSTATGNLDSKITTVSGLIVSNDTDLTALNTATGLLNTSVLELQTATGLLQTATGVLETVTGFFAQTGSKPIIFAQDISTLGGTISADQGTFSEVRGTIKTPIQNDIKSLQLQNLTVTGGNFVGIGTASPNAELDVSGELRVNGPLNLIESHAYKISNQEWARLKNNSIQIGDLNSNDFSTAIFGNGGHQVITITGDGGQAADTNVGIGTTGPQAKLHVAGNTILSGVLTVTGDINSPTINSLVQKSETGVLLTSGEIQTNIDAAVANLVDSAPATLNTLNELAAALGDDQNFSTTTATSLGNLSTATGVLNTSVTALQAVSGSFAQTGSTQSVTFNEIFLHGDLRFKNPTEGIIFTNNEGNERYGLKVGNSGNLGGSNNIMLTNREATGNLLFGTAGTVGGSAEETERMRITHDGNVGIGTTSPQANLHIAKGEGTVPSLGSEVGIFQNNDNTSDNVGIGLIAGTSGNAFIHFGDADSNNQGQIAFKNTSNDLAFKTSATERLTILSGGNVGIRTTTPNEALHVSGNIRSNGIIKAINSDASVAQLEVGRNNSELIEMKVSDSNCFITANQDSDSNGSHGFVLDRVFAGSGPNNFVIQKNGSTQARIDTSGNMCIGTGVPAAKLHVEGDTLLSGKAVVRNGNFGLNTGDPKATFHIKQRAAANTGGIRITEHNDDNTWSIWANDSSSLFFQHATTSDGSPSSKMFLTSAGVLNVKGNLDLSENDSVFTNKGTSQQTGDAIFHNSISGSTISGTSLFITDGVGIGTTSITAGKILDVNGDVKATSIEAQEINLKEADGYFIEDKQFAKFENNTLKFGDHDGEGFTTDIFGNGAIPMIRITGDGSQAANTFLGIGTTAPQAKLHVNGDTILSGGLIVNGDVKFGTGTAIGPLHLFDTGETDATLARFENTSSTSADHDANVQIISRGAGESTIHFINKDNTHTNGYQIGHGDAFGEALFFLNKHDNRTDMVISQAGRVGIGETSPNATLHVDGDTILSGNLDISGSITPAKDVAFDIGSPTKRFKDLYLSGDSIFLGDTKLSISGDELQTRRGGVVRRAPLRDNLNQTRNLIVTGNSVLGKCSLSANSFVTETGDFTLGLNHRGATVLLQNPAAITITCPALVPGHVTTFIAETQHIASFATGVGMSGLNSFNGASEMAGIFAQAQIIYKSLSGAFLGGNIV